MRLAARHGAWLFVVAGLGGCGAPAAPAVHGLTGQAFGTSWSVRWVAGDTPDEAAVRARIDERLAEVDQQMSTWRPDSELSLARAADGPVPVSAGTAHVVAAALALAERSGGAFDPTVQPLVELWGIHHTRREHAPSEAEIDAARAMVGWERVKLGGEAGAFTLDDGGTALDLSAIAKGYGVDQVGEGLADLGLDRWMVEVGGEVRVAGRGPNGPWRLGVDDPEAGAAPGAALAAVVLLESGGLATSGNYRNVYEVDGVRVVHTLDPRLGRPVQSNVLSAAVVAPTCMEADGLATALMVLGTAGLPLVEARPGVEALLMQSGGQRTLSSGMSAYLAPAGAPPAGY